MNRTCIHKNKKVPANESNHYPYIEISFSHFSGSSSSRYVEMRAEKTFVKEVNDYQFVVEKRILIDKKEKKIIKVETL